MMNRRCRVALAAAVAAAATGLTVLIVPTSAWAAEFDVRQYGATGNGSTNDTPAINRAIDAANAAGGGTVRFTSGTYLSANTIHMRSNITLQLDSGATILGADDDDYDAPESNPNDDFQDYGHSHFHNAMIYGDRLTNIGFTGSGTIDGGGNLITGNPDSGEADKIISLTRCTGLRVDGIRLRRGGHFAMLTNACNNITSTGLRVDTASDRDGWNVINAQNVTVTGATIAANDDALVFKSDWALGTRYSNGHVRVTDSRLSAVCCNALMFGSETCGDFTDYVFDGITITGAGKSGLGIVSMDGTHISDVHYRNITMTGTRGHIMEKVGTRRRCGDSPGVGNISNITYENVTGSYNGSAGAAYSSTLWGESASANRIRNVTFTNVDLTVPGGNGTMSTAVPSNDPNNYNPNSIGTRPAYGWYVHNAENISFVDSSVEFASNDGRPAVIANTGSGVTLDRFTAERGSNSPYDVGFQSISGYCVSSSSLRVNATSSSQSCTPSTTVTVRAEAESGTETAPMQVGSDANASGGQYVAVAAGNSSEASPPSAGYATIPFSVPSAGTYTVWGRVIAPTVDSDSFWVRVDSGAWTKWNDIAAGSSWHWANVTDDNASDARVLVNLAAGNHTLTFAYREEGTRLDRVLVTNDLSLVPSGVAG